MKKNIILFLILSFITCYSIGQTYHTDDKEGLRAFLRQQAPITGEINAQQLGLQLSDTLNWHTEETWVSKIAGLTWNESSPKRLITIGCYPNYEWQHKNLSGNLNCNCWNELIRLNCDYNQIQTIDASNNTALIYLSCRNNLLESIDITNCVVLQTLSCSFNQLSTLDVSNNIVLEGLWCDSNQLTTLDVSANTDLGCLSCGDNQLTALDVSNNINLEMLGCEKNQLKILDLESNTKIFNLTCYSNQLTNLDLSNQGMWLLDCRDNKLTTLVANDGVFVLFLCSHNYLLFSKIPPYRNCTYNPQHTVDGGDVVYKAGIDLSAEYNVGEKITQFSWFDITAGDEQALELTGENGLFLLTKDFVGKYLRCKMTNTTFPELISVYEVKIVDEVGIEIYDVAEQFHIYPNPTTGELRITNENTSTTLGAGLRIENIEIFDVYGKKVFTKSINSNTEINIRHLPNGIYMILIISEQQVISKHKIIKL